MINEYEKGLRLFHFDKLTKFEDISHFVTTRIGGRSLPPYDGLNLSISVGDNPDKVQQNRELLASVVGIAPGSFVFCRQVHGNDIFVLDQNPRNRGSDNFTGPIANADAVITNVPGTCIIVLVADCVPVLFFDPMKKVIGVVHAGWRGTLKRVVRHTVAKLINRYRCLPDDIRVGIGPSIGSCCYEVGPEVISEFETIYDESKEIVVSRKDTGKGNVNLWRVNWMQLIQAGIPENNIELAEICTCCKKDLFFSYRCLGPESGRFAAGIMLKS